MARPVAWLNSFVYIVDQSTPLNLISTCMTRCKCHKLQWRAVETCFKKLAHVVEKSQCNLASLSTFNFSFPLCNSFYQSPRLASFSSLKPLCLILFCPLCMFFRITKYGFEISQTSIFKYHLTWGGNPLCEWGKGKTEQRAPIYEQLCVVKLLWSVWWRYFRDHKVF